LTDPYCPVHIPNPTKKIIFGENNSMYKYTTFKMMPSVKIV